MVLNEMLAIEVPGRPARRPRRADRAARRRRPRRRQEPHRARRGGDRARPRSGRAGVRRRAQARGIGPVVGADFSPRRRALAEHLGCDVVVDPAERPAIAAWREVDGVRPLVIFEAVGVPGMIDAAMRMAPKGARILVVGVCMQQDRVHPMVGIGRELNIQFALGYEPDEFAQALRSIAEGEVDLAPADHRHRRDRRRPAGVRRPRPTPRPTPRSSSSR